MTKPANREMVDFNEFADQYHRSINGNDKGLNPQDGAITLDPAYVTARLENAERSYKPLPNNSYKETMNISFSGTLGDLLSGSYTKNNEKTTWKLSDPTNVQTNMYNPKQISVASKIGQSSSTEASTNSLDSRHVLVKAKVLDASNTLPYSVGLRIDGLNINKKAWSRPSISNCTTFIGSNYAKQFSENEVRSDKNTGPDFVIGAQKSHSSPQTLFKQQGIENITSQLKNNEWSQLTEEAIEKTILAKNPEKYDPTTEKIYPAHWIVKEPSPLIEVASKLPGIGTRQPDGSIKNMSRICSKTGDQVVLIRGDCAEAAHNILKINLRSMPFWDPNKIQVGMSLIGDKSLNPDHFDEDQLNTLHHVNATVEVTTHNIPLGEKFN